MNLVRQPKRHCHKAIKKLVFILHLSWYGVLSAGTFQTITLQQNNAFRWDIMKYVQSEAAEDTSRHAKPSKILAQELDKRWISEKRSTLDFIRWSTEVTFYLHGEKVGAGKAIAPSLSGALSQATKKALKTAKLTTNQLKLARIRVAFFYPPDQRQYVLISNKNHPNWALELIGNVIPVRQMDTALVKSHIKLEKSYLLRIEDPKFHGFFKLYDSGKNKKESKLRTIYTASSLFTLLQVNKIFPDHAIDKQANQMAQFLLMMQEKTGKNAGAFHYSYDIKTHQKDNHFVVGTASKTIFTLLLLYKKTNNEKYLKAAKDAGNWLLTKVDTEGHVNPVVSRINGKDIQITKQSFLYSGQVLSALSRLYAVTQDKAYYNSASYIARHMVVVVKKQGPFVGDDYRSPNSVTTSWLVMALLDYAKINQEPQYRETMIQCATELTHHQIQAPWDAFNHGRLMDIITTSGNGWVNEVMTSVYPFCQDHKMSGCEAYKLYVIHASRWLIQNVYTEQNMYNIKDPDFAEGGLIRSFAEKAVRTDAVCHGVNSLVGLLNIVGMENQSLEFLPEKPIEEVIKLLRMGGRTS